MIGYYNPLEVFDALSLQDKGDLLLIASKHEAHQSVLFMRMSFITINNEPQWRPQWLQLLFPFLLYDIFPWKGQFIFISLWDGNAALLKICLAIF